MSGIDKLLIRGIRSFNPYGENVIEFYTPLTIIVGQNGAGKTTIIECLKYATTGNAPPNSKGGAFIYDPKLSNESEVKAQIKLKFRNVSGQIMVVTRSLQSTQKKQKLEQKTLESVLSTSDPNTGEQVSISSRCAELDTLVPYNLGVSSSVLESVIFCHQEESFWPLSEPSVLKKKFDEIFSATKYTKALDSIKALKKDLTSDLKLESQKLNFLKSDREKAAKIIADIDGFRSRTQSIATSIEFLEKEIESLNSKLRDSIAVFDRNSSLTLDLERVKNELEIADNIANELRLTMTELCDSDQTLRQKLEDHKNILGNREQVKKECLNAKMSLEALLEKSSAESIVNLSRIRTLENDIAVFSKKESEKYQLISELERLLDTRFDAEDVSQYDSSFVGQKIQNVECLLQFKQLELKKRESDYTENLQRLFQLLSFSTQSRKVKLKTIEDNKDQIYIYMNSIEDAIVHRSHLGNLEVRVLEYSTNLQRFRQSLDFSSFEQNISELLKRKHAVEEQFTLLNSKIIASSKFCDIRAKLSTSEALKQRKLLLCKKTVEDICSEYYSICERKAESSTINEAIEALLHEIEDSRRLIDSQIERAKVDCLVVESSLKEAANRRESLKNELSEKLRLTGSAAFLEEEKQLRQTLSSLAVSLFVQNSHKEHSCPLCLREFASPLEEAKFSERLAEISIGKAPKLEDAFDVLKTKIDGLNNVERAKLDYKRIAQTDLPNIDGRIKSQEDRKEALNSKVEELLSRQKNCGLREKRASLLRKKADDVNKINIEVSVLESEISHYRSELLGENGLDEIDALQNQSNELRSSMKKLDSDIEGIRMEKKIKEEELSRREIRLQAAKEELMKLQLKLSEMASAEKRKIELESANNILLDEVELTNIEVLELEKQVQSLKTRQNHEIDAMKQEIQAVQSRLSQTSLKHSKLVSLNSELKNLLDRLCNDQEKIDEQLQQARAEISIICGKIDSSSKESVELSLMHRNLTNNIRFRELRSKKAELIRTCEEISMQLGAFDKIKAVHETNVLKRKISDSNGDRSGLLGENKQLEAQIARLNRELETDYAEVVFRHREQFIRVQAVSAGIEDLEKYATALDSAIMKYHSFKIEEINKIVHEIWTRTYQGADIDAVGIRAEHDMAAGNRTYNYRVFMKKGDAELDMRGRSSAGQRVLASLIIRLALAETFGQHCGILSLDEPTTNLDRENIESLAESLAEIVKIRRQQNNFQLIIITHDEEFVELLGRYECADYYWRVFKDENQFSRIERQSFQGALR